MELLKTPIVGAGGGKGGGGGSAPSESPNTLQSNAVARVIDLISEGEIIGLYTGEGADGKDFPLKAVYFDNIPVQDSDGDYVDAGLSEPELSHWSNLTGLNYEGVEMWERLGLHDQDSIPEFSEVESEITINQEVTDASPVLFVVADNDVDSIRLKVRLPALYEQNSEGSLVPASLNYTVEVKESGGSYFEIQDKTISGKNTSPYEYAKEFIFDELAGAPLTFPLTFRVTRVTRDSDKASKQQDLFVNSYTEIQKVKIKYNDSAIVAIKVDSQLFSGRVPSRSFLVRGIKVQVPSNYFPETRLYNRNVTTGAEELDVNGNPDPQAWDGLFYTAWTDNPAWVLYDLLTNPRYGLGEFIDADTQVDIYSLYDIAVYCDQKLDNGLGNGQLEPRYTFNGVIATREDAFDVINAVTSTFRGMSFWSAGGVTAVADSPKDPKRLITRANVEKGNFTYSGTALRAQHTSSLVTYNDPDNNYKQTVEVVEDATRRERLGWREIEVAAFATTSRGQAYRLGKWILDSEKNESETLAFTGPVELSDLRPGDITQVADPAQQQVRRGGRILSHTAGTPDVIVVDEPRETYDGDTLLVTNEIGGIESLPVEQSVASTTITLKSVSAIVNFVDSDPDTIVRTDGGNWITDGFFDGQSITVSDAAEAGNNDTFSVDTVTDTTLTLASAETLTADTADTITVGHTPTQNLMINAIYIHRGADLVPAEWRVLSMRETEELRWEFSCLTYDSTKYARIEGVRSTAVVDFVDSGPDTIVRSDGGSWITDGFVDGQSITVGDADESANNGIFTVDSVTATTLTLSADAELTADTDDYINIGTPAIILDAPPTSFLPSGPLLPATNLTIFESIYKAGSSVNVLLDINWTRSTDPRAQIYRVETRFRKTLSDPVDTWRLLEGTPTASIRAQVPDAEAGYWSFRVITQISQSEATQSSSILQVDDYEIIGKTAPPPDVANLTADRMFSTIVLDWDDVDDIDLTGYVVQRGPAWNDDYAATEVLANPVFASTLTTTVNTTANQTYHVRAVDTLGNLSEAVTSITTSVLALDAVVNLYAYQVGEAVRVTWDALSGVDNIQYNIKYGPTTGTIGAANEFATIASSEFQGMLTVDKATVVRFYVRPFVELNGGARSYGAPSTIDITVYPLLNGFRVLSRTEETAWSSSIADVDEAFLNAGIEFDEQFEDGDLINPVLNENYLTGQTPGHVARSRDASFHCMLTISSSGTPIGSIMELGNDDNAGLYIGFDSAGDLIYRAGRSDDTPKIDETSQIHHWTMDETSGTRNDSEGTNHLTDVGTVTNVDGQISKAAEFISADSTTLTGGPVTLANNDMTIILWYRFNANAGNNEDLLMGGHATYGTSIFMRSYVLPGIANGLIFSMRMSDGSGGGFSFTGEDYTEDGGPFDYDTWYMTTMRWDDTAKELTIGANGVMHPNPLSKPGLTIEDATDLTFGNTFDGDIDDVRIFSRWLTDEELLAHYEDSRNDRASITIPNASLPKDSSVDLLWDVRVGDESGNVPGRIRMWLDGTLTEAEVDADLSFVTEDGKLIWADTDEGKYNGYSGTYVQGEAGAYYDPLNAYATLDTDLSYWRDTLVHDPLEVFSGALTLTEGSTYGRYDFPFQLPSTKIGRLWAEMTASVISADPLYISEGLMEINDATFDIEEDLDEQDPQVDLWIDIGDTGTFIPFEPGTYQFQNATVRAVLRRGRNDQTRPAIDNLSVYFTEQPTDATLQASTTDATQTTMTYDGETATAVNIPTIPDDFTARVTGRLIGRRDSNGDILEIDFVANLQRGTGAASTTVTYSLTEYERDDSSWVFSIEADTTYGGLALKVTGDAGADIEWACDIDVREVG